MKAGRPARFDYEYERNGTANLFMMFAPLEGWRHVKVTDRHTAVDYARVLKDLADILLGKTGKPHQRRLALPVSRLTAGKIEIIDVQCWCLAERSQIHEYLP
jgi:hypothetical protein